jgi:hypothetical protein
MKTINLVAVAVFAIISGWSFRASGQAVQFVTLLNTNSSQSVQYSLQTNQVISVVGSYGTATLLGVFADGTSIRLPFPSSGPFQIFTGLTNIVLQAGNTTLCATLQITTPPSANVVSNYVPADAIVIPASATGNVQIILESSADLLNWTAANPGIYGPSSGTNRFFRVRAIQN